MCVCMHVCLWEKRKQYKYIREFWKTFNFLVILNENIIVNFELWNLNYFNDFRFTRINLSPLQLSTGHWALWHRLIGQSEEVKYTKIFEARIHHDVTISIVILTIYYFWFCMENPYPELNCPHFQFHSKVNWFEGGNFYFSSVFRQQIDIILSRLTIDGHKKHTQDVKAFE